MKNNNRQYIKKTLSIFYRILSSYIILLGAILAVLYLCGIRLYHVKSGSMGDEIPIGSVCFVSTYSSYEKIQTGDIISFRVSDGLLVTHRAEKITADGIITKGDENDNNDPVPVTSENYIGKTVFAIPRIGNIIGFVHTIGGKICLGISLLILLILGKYCRTDTEQSSG